MGAPSVDLNSDLGEGYGVWRLGDDEAMLKVVTSANIACGFHAGDPLTLRRTVVAAAERGVRVGAQVSYPDLAGFGRRFIDIDPDELAAGVIYQIGALDGLARAAGSRVSYVKPHGALYNAIVRHEAQAAAVVGAVSDYDPDLPVVGLPGSLFLRLAAAAGLRTVAEAFADRGYRPDGSLVPRTAAGAMLHDPAAIAARVLGMVCDAAVTAVDGSRVSVRPDSVCVHGDTPGAVAIAQAVRAALLDNGVRLQAFVA